MLHCAQGATVLPRDAHGVRALFHNARLGEPQDPSGIAHRLGHELMRVPPHLRLIPDALTEKPLQPPDGAPLALEGHGLDRLAFQLTELTDHRVKEMHARLTAGK